ncbi:glycosyltransferase [uncultured Chryseobacterium sp.]|uniref:glycosyltransferase n=1 Tax=uncultured Chryseobacterium sp. TaxID=259322 RepID=UPI0025EBF759|nr:glycosyltransferase [uncultured Chryseobacterium sp.]
MDLSNNNLAIAIPTYNRASILDENLRYIIQEIKKYKIPIYISDDSNNNETQKKIEILKLEYPFINYFKNAKSLGHDKNCLYTISLPVEEYVWYLGDSMIIIENSIDKVIKILNEGKYDFLSLNTVGRNLSVKSQEYSDPRSIMEEIGWHLTLTGSTIYKKSTLNLKGLNLQKCKNFPQLALIFKEFKNKKMFWVNDKLITSNAKKKSYWENDVFKVFIDDYYRTLDYVFGSSPQNEEWVFEHMNKSQLFSYSKLLNLRTTGSLSTASILKYQYIFEKLSSLKKTFIYLLSVIPKKWLGILEMIILNGKKNIKSFNKRS